MVELWEEVLAHLRERVGKQNFETWIKPIRFRSLTSDGVSLEVPNKFFRGWLTEHYSEQISEILKSLLHRKVKVVVSVNNHLQPAFGLEKSPIKEERDRLKPHRSDNLIAKYTFENFVVGASNQFAHAASMAVANQPTISTGNIQTGLLKLFTST